MPELDQLRSCELINEESNAELISSNAYTVEHVSKTTTDERRDYIALPVKIRLKIYQHVFHNAQVVLLWQNWHSAEEAEDVFEVSIKDEVKVDLRGLLGASKATRVECLPFFLANATLKLKGYRREVLFRYISYIGKSYTLWQITNILADSRLPWDYAASFLRNARHITLVDDRILQYHEMTILVTQSRYTTDTPERVTKMGDCITYDFAVAKARSAFSDANIELLIRPFCYAYHDALFQPLGDTRFEFRYSSKYEFVSTNLREIFDYVQEKGSIY